MEVEVPVNISILDRGRGGGIRKSCVESKKLKVKTVRTVFNTSRNERKKALKVIKIE